MNVQSELALEENSHFASADAVGGDGSLAWYQVVGIELGLLGTIVAPLLCCVLLAR
jgi:hypothetical protein